MSDEPCELLPWDSEFFGMTIARVKQHWLSVEMGRAIDAWCEARQVRCLYCNLASFGGFPTANVAEAAGFRLVDVKLSMIHRTTAATDRAGVSHIRPATSADLPVLEPMAAKNHGDGRFNYDCGFPRGKSEEMFRVWIRKSVVHSDAGTRDPELDERHHCVVAERDGAVCGYSALKITHNENIGIISLLGVDPSVYRMGVGRDLVVASLDYFVSQKTPTILLHTQAHNIAAQRLYQRCGFVTSGCTFVYHKWYSHG